MPYDNPDDEWNTTSGLPLDGLTATVTALEFGFNHQIGPNVVCANFTLTDDEGNEVQQSFSVGQNHKPNRDGTVLEGEKQFSSMSNFGRLVMSAKEIVEGIGTEIGSPKVAANWIGTKWTFGGIAVESSRPDGTDRKEYTKFVFTEYHGRVDGDDGGDAPAKASAPKAKSGGGGRVTAKPAPATPSASNGIDPELWDRLVAEAKNHEDHGDFASEALDWDGVDGVPAAMKAVASQGKGSVWAAR